MLGRQTDSFALPTTISQRNPMSEGFTFWRDAAATRPGGAMNVTKRDDYYEQFIRNDYSSAQFLTLELSRRSREFFKIIEQPHVLQPQQVGKIVFHNYMTFESPRDETALFQVVNEPYEKNRPLFTTGYLSLWFDKDATVPFKMIQTRSLEDTPDVREAVFYARNDSVISQPVGMSIDDPQDGMSFRIEGKGQTVQYIDDDKLVAMDLDFYSPGQIVRIIITVPSKYVTTDELKLSFVKEPIGELPPPWRRVVP